MKRLLVSVTVAAALIVAASAVAAPQHAGCVAGMTKVGGVDARTFCGPAKATVHIGGKTVLFKNGKCEKGPAGWSINIGTVVLGTANKKPEYFGIAAKAKPGTQSNAAVAVDHAGKGFAVTGNTVTLKPGLKSGTFTGTVFGTSGTISGSFSC